MARCRSRRMPTLRNSMYGPRCSPSRRWSSRNSSRMRSRDGLQRRASFDGISLDDGEHGAATSVLHRGAAVTMWGTSPRQRLRLRPLEGALRSADWLGARGLWWRGVNATREWPPGVSIVIPERDAPAMLSEALASVTA